MLKKKYSAFTLVELIIVITILGILATIAFVSFQSYTKDARDSNRLASLKSIEKGLQAFQVTTGNYPEPENYTIIQASGFILGTQGYIGDTISKQININKTPIDPSDKNQYIYASNNIKSKYQLLSFTEGNKNLGYSNVSYAENTRNTKTIGNNIGIFLDNNISLSGSNIDILQTQSGNTYKVIFQNNDQVIQNGGTLFSHIYNRRDDLLKNKALFGLDSNLVTYWDMESRYERFPSFYYMKDLSNHSAHMACFNSGSAVNCGVNNLGPQLVENGKYGKALYFDGIDDYMLSSSPYWNGIFNNEDGTGFTISFLMETKTVGRNSILGGRYGDTMCVFQDSDGKVSLSMDDTRSGSPKSNNPVSGQNFITIVYKNNGINSSATYFINGNSEGFLGTSWDGNGIDLSGNMYVGWQSRQDNITEYPGFFNGVIDEVRFYNRPLHESEVYANYISLIK